MSMYAYRDTLIGPSGKEITRGYSGIRGEYHYSWSVSIDSDSGRLIVEVARNGSGARVARNEVPLYVWADIARVMTLGTDESLATNERTTRMDGADR